MILVINLQYRIKKLLMVLVVGLAAVGGHLFGHHSATAYELDKPITLEGTVTLFELVNPHALVHFVVKDKDGVETKWVAETIPPQRLYRMHGWKKDSLKAGDIVTIIGFQRKDGAKEVRIKKITSHRDGRTFENRPGSD